MYGYIGNDRKEGGDANFIEKYLMWWSLVINIAVTRNHPLVGGVLRAVFLGSLLKCPNSKHFFFQDGVDEGQRHWPVASQQTRINRRAVDTSEYCFPAHSVSNRQYTAMLFQSVAAGEAKTAPGDAASSPADRWRGGLLLLEVSLKSLCYYSHR